MKKYADYILLKQTGIAIRRLQHVVCLHSSVALVAWNQNILIKAVNVKRHVPFSIVCAQKGENCSVSSPSCSIWEENGNRKDGKGMQIYRHLSAAEGKQFPQDSSYASRCLCWVGQSTSHLSTSTWGTFEPQCQKTYLQKGASSDEPARPAHLRSVILIFTGRLLRYQAKVLPTGTTNTCTLTRLRMCRVIWVLVRRSS